MAKTDPRIDAYIEKSAEFARPILRHIRQLVHANCPQVEETMKWSFPHFMHHGILCSMAAFKEHCSFGFWHPSLRGEQLKGEGMGQFGRIVTIGDVPAEAKLAKMIRQGMHLNETGQRPVRPKRKPRPAPKMPADLKAALANDRAAQERFASFPPSHQREYVEWITEAKREETRVKRIAMAVQQIAEGKSRYWKYEKC